MAEVSENVLIKVDEHRSLAAELLWPESPRGVVIVLREPATGGSGSRERQVARSLSKRGYAAVIVDLPTATSDEKAAALDPASSTDCVYSAIAFANAEAGEARLPVGIFGARASAAVALATAAKWPEEARAVVAYGGQFDRDVSPDAIRAPSLLLVGSRDGRLVKSNRAMMQRLRGTKALTIIQGAENRLEEPEAVESVAEAAGEWFDRYLRPESQDQPESSAQQTLSSRTAPSAPEAESEVGSLIRAVAEPFNSLEEAQLAPLLERVGDAKVVLIGEATHGTSEFYRMRARITQELISKKGFTIVAAEADWPDAEHVDEYVSLREKKPTRKWEAFARFPTWMWRNEETLTFIEWLKQRNEAVGRPERRAGFYGLDMYSLNTSMHEVISYLESRDAELADMAKQRYRTLLSYQHDPIDYGRSALRDRYTTSEDDVVQMLTDLLERRLALVSQTNDGERFFDAERNAAVVASAEKYYRLVFRGSYESWNHRDQHMLDTLKALLDFRGTDAKAVVWAHNSHVGDAAWTQMGDSGETNLGELSRNEFGDGCYLIGFGTHVGTVAAATDWGGQVEIKGVRPSRKGSYEHLFHEEGPPSFLLPLKGDGRLREARLPPRLERAIGVIYRPDTELLSHYFQADLPYQFDEYIWFDKSRAVSPLSDAERAPELPDRHPFLLVD